MSTSAAPARPDTEVRAYHVRTTLQLLGEVDPSAPARVRGHLASEALAAIDDASRLTWLPGAIDIALWRAADLELGTAGAARLARAVGLRHVRSGQLSGLLQGVVQLFGLTPAALVRWMPRGLAEVHRGVGTLRVDDLSEGAARLVLEELHPALTDEPWLTAVARSLEFPLDLCALDGEATLERAGPEQAVILLRWRRRAPRP